MATEGFLNNATAGQKRKAEEDLPNSPPLSDQLDPLEQVSKAREELGELLTPDKKSAAVNFDIEQNIREIRAILKMNAEILNRCKKFISAPSGHSFVAALLTKARSYGTHTTTFSRIRFAEVQVRKMRNVGTQFITRPIRDKQSFDTKPLSKLPKELDDIVVKHNMTEEKLKNFIDFEKFFNKSLILHDSVLSSFLPKLKEHLMTIQVCLGRIDSWVIQEPQVAIGFLDATFGKEIDIPDDNAVLGPHQCKCKSHPAYQLCLKCGKTLISHTVHGGKMLCNIESVGGEDQFFTCEVYQVLNQVKVKGKHETSFDITNVNEQMRLKKFLEFISIS